MSPAVGRHWFTILVTRPGLLPGAGTANESADPDGAFWGQEAAVIDWKNHRHRAELTRVLRFGIVGLASTALYMGLFTLLLQLMPPVPASVLAYALSAVANFIVQSRFTFRAPLHAAGMVRFICMNLFCMGVNSSLLWIATSPLLLPPIPSQLVITLFVAGLSYLISKYWVYANQPGSAQPVSGGPGEAI